MIYPSAKEELNKNPAWFYFLFPSWEPKWNSTGQFDPQVEERKSKVTLPRFKTGMWSKTSLKRCSIKQALVYILWERAKRFQPLWPALMVFQWKIMASKFKKVCRDAVGFCKLNVESVKTHHFAKNCGYHGNFMWLWQGGVISFLRLKMSKETICIIIRRPFFLSVILKNGIFC